MSLFDLTGKVALVTGSTKGIGRGIVERMAEYGAKTIVTGRDQQQCSQVASELNQRYGKGKTVACGIASDLRSLPSLQALVDRTIEQFGRIDVLVNNAAIMGYHGASADTPDSNWKDLLEGNIFNYFKLCHMVSPQMIERRDGSIIFITSTAGLVSQPDIMAYAVSKAGEMHLARCLAKELAPFNVRVNAISPGMIRSEASRPLWSDEEVLRSNTQSTPLPRIGEPDEIAAAVIFLAGRGGGYTVGATIPIDGGIAMLGRIDNRDAEARSAAYAKTGGISGR